MLISLPTSDPVIVGEIGSHAHGLATADSDHDFHGIFIESPAEVIGVASRPESKRLRSLNGVKRLHHVHTLVLEAFVGPRPDGMEACHGKGGRQDNRLTNLRWDTSTENSFDYVRAGDHHYAKRDSCLYGHPLPPSTIGTARKCRKCYIDGMAESSDKRTMVRILRKYGLA